MHSFGKERLKLQLRFAKVVIEHIPKIDLFDYSNQFKNRNNQLITNMTGFELFLAWQALRVGNVWILYQRRITEPSSALSLRCSLACVQIALRRTCSLIHPREKLTLVLFSDFPNVNVTAKKSFTPIPFFVPVSPQEI